jgi:hypothetical protein
MTRSSDETQVRSPKRNRGTTVPWLRAVDIERHVTAFRGTLGPRWIRGNRGLGAPDSYVCLPVIAENAVPSFDDRVKAQWRSYLKS